MKLLFILFPVLLLLVSCGGKSNLGEKNFTSTKQAHLSNEDAINISCFVYHRFGDDRYPSTNISTDIFKQQLDYLKNNDFKVLTLGEALDRLNIKNEAAGKIAVITIDDGYKSFLSGAMPLLKEYGFKATMFINTKTVGGQGYLDWNALKKLSEEGIEIGNHTHTHDYFLNYDENEIADKFKEDVLKAQKLIEENLGIKCELFAYPYGEYNKEMKQLIKELGFRAAAAQNSGVISRDSDLYALPRFPMGSSFATLDGFKEKVNMKAMPVSVEQEANVIAKSKRPELKLIVESDILEISRINCFVQGSKDCSVTRNSQNNELIIKSQSDLTNRRTLYTLTAPSKDGSSWYWFSHLWIQPDVEE